MFNRYYQRELQNLRELAAEFSRVHPAAAPLLSGQSSDPDVERLLEGVAFLMGLMRRKLDDELPEIIHGLADIVLPHYLRPIPATSVVAFTPKPGLQETIRVPAGTTLASLPVEGTVCRFRTCFELEVHPLRLTAAETLRKTGEADRIRLAFESRGPDLSRLDISRLSFYLGGSYVQATDLHMLFSRYVRRITIRPETAGQPCVLPSEMLKPAGFLPRNALFPFPSQAFSGYRLLQEYFVLPQKFLVFELGGWDRWRERGSGTRFEVLLDMEPAPVPLPNLSASQLFLYTTPVINLFSHEADPIQLDHRQEKVRVKPSLRQSGALQVYSIDRVTGFREGTVEKKAYAPLNLFAPHATDTTLYQVLREISPVYDTPESYLVLTYPPDGPDPAREVLTIELTCTNGKLSEGLRLGDISQPTSESPELLTFQNILPTTSPIDPMLAGKGVWQLLSHLSLNLLPLLHAEGLRELLRIYLYPEARDRVKIAANLKRVEGITEVVSNPSDRLVAGSLMRGQEIAISARQDHFAGMGDLFVFGSVLDEFFSQYSSMNAFTRLKIKDLISGETLTWPERIGDRPLM